MGIVYRTWQFWQALLASPSAEDLEFVHSILSPEQISLFESMDNGDQVHCIKTLHRLLEMDRNQSDLLVAALLHDVGKNRYPIGLWERVWLVLGNTFIPGVVERWRQEHKSDIYRVEWWKRVFIVADRHAAWGAELAQKAGASSLSVNLIMRHQDKLIEDLDTLENKLLSYLQEADNLS